MRINDKIEELENYLSELGEIVPKTFYEYKNDIKTRAACERYFEKIMGAAIDLAFLIIKNENLKIPEEDKEAFDILAKEKIIPEKLSEKLKEAKGMRNVVAHEYGKLDDELVFNSITEELENDITEFIKNAKLYLKK